MGREGYPIDFRTLIALILKEAVHFLSFLPPTALATYRKVPRLRLIMGNCSKPIAGKYLLTYSIASDRFILSQKSN